jgi:hypothetical protein
MNNRDIVRGKLTHVACKDSEGKIWSLPAPLRHHNIFFVMQHFGAKPGHDIAYDQGFLDEHGRYYTRRQAEVNADIHNQLKGGKRIGSILTSEDLW